MRGARATAAAAAATVLLGGALAGCTLITDSFRTNDFSGDPFPIHVGTESGAVMLGVREPGGPQLDAVLDVLSPVTITDPGVGKPKALVTSDLILLGRREPGAAAFDVPRARIRSAAVISLHPCDESDEEPVCTVGPPGAPLPYGAVIGADALAGDALRLRLGDDQAFVLADIGGDERDRTFVCDAVFPSPYRGGGTLVIADTEVPFGGRRVTLQACLGDDPDPTLVPGVEPEEPARQILQGARGGDALLVLSTGIGVSLLGETAYERYRQSILLRQQYAGRRPTPPPPPPPPLGAQPDTSVNLPSGPVFGQRRVIDRIALAAASGSSPRAPCRQAYTHHLMLLDRQDGLPAGCQDGDDCPCTGGNTFCAAPAIVELEPPGGLEVLVVPDGDPTLLALRAELRPDQPEVDGVLGTDALRLAEIDVDYPHDRVLMRCTAPAPGCQARPALAAAADLAQVRGCLARP